MSKTDAIELTRTLIQFQSANPPGNETACASHVAELLRAGGFATEIHRFGADRVNVVARRGDISRGSPICLTGHLDTVPIGAASWSVDPFGAEIVNDKLYGRGSSDMKSGVAAMVTAALSVGDLLDDGPGLLLILTGGEETGCEGAAHLASLNDFLGEAGAIVVGEPTGNQPRIGHKGALWLLAACHGRAAHGAAPDLGVNAIYRGADVVRKLQKLEFNGSEHAGLGAPTLNVSRMNGGTSINTVPDLVEISVDIRTVPGMEHSILMEELNRHLAPDIDELSILLDLESVWTSPHDPWVSDTREWIAPNDPHSASCGVPFFTDASVLCPLLGNPPALILGPGETHMAHQTDEYCFVHRIPEAVSIYRRLILDWQTRVAPANTTASV